MSESNVVQFPFKDLSVKPVSSQLAEKEEIVNLENINDIEQKSEVSQRQIEEQSFKSFSDEQIEKIKAETSKKAVLETEVKLKSEFAIEKQALIDEVSNIKNNFESLQLTKTKLFEDVVRTSSNLAITIAKKIIGESAESHSNKVIEFFQSIVSKLDKEDSIIINLSSKNSQELKNKIEEAAAKSSYNGVVKTVINDNSDSTICEIVWANGAAQFNQDEMLKKIDAIFQSHMPEEGKVDVKAIEEVQVLTTATEGLPNE